jgi:hypothetical protein
MPRPASRAGCRQRRKLPARSDQCKSLRDTLHLPVCTMWDMAGNERVTVITDGIADAIEVTGDAVEESACCNAIVNSGRDPQMSGERVR